MPKKKKTVKEEIEPKCILYTKIKPCLLTIRMIIFWFLSYTVRPKSLRTHRQRSACLKLGGSFKISDSKAEYAIYFGAVYICPFIAGDN
jgi:hypothetical protein